jgi:hypothetical protein
MQSVYKARALVFSNGLTCFDPGIQAIELAAVEYMRPNRFFGNGFWGWLVRTRSGDGRMQ